MKIGRSDIGGGVTPRPGISGQGAGIAEAPEADEGPVGFIDKANEFLDGILGMAKRIDQVIGLIVEAKKAQDGQQRRTIDGERANPGPSGHLAPGNPGPATPESDVLLRLMDRIIEAEGDIPLSKLLEGIRGQEAWLVKYAQEIVEGQSPE